MLFHKPTKTAFVLPPKNGTTSLMTFLRKLDFKFVPNKNLEITNIGHPFPKDLVEIHPNLLDYTVYGFFRNPLDRYISILKMYKRLNQLITPKNFTDSDSTQFKLPNELLARQFQWFDHPKIVVLDFDNYENEVLEIGKKYGKPDLLVPKLNAGKIDVELTSEEKLFVREYYAADYQFAKEKLNKVYFE